MSEEGQRTMVIKNYRVCANNIDKELKEEFSALCKKKGLTESRYLVMLMKKEIENAKRSNH